MATNNTEHPFTDAEIEELLTVYFHDYEWDGLTEHNLDFARSEIRKAIDGDVTAHEYTLVRAAAALMRWAEERERAEGRAEGAAEMRERAAVEAEATSGGDASLSKRALIARRIRALPLTPDAAPEVKP